ncbi:MAG: ATPase [Spirochaetaceae bacterium]|nr:ATPase [Spirochaetaceae bacterium]
MARTEKMEFVRLMILKEDIEKVMEYLGKQKNFELTENSNPDSDSTKNVSLVVFNKLQQVREFLKIDDISILEDATAASPRDEDYQAAEKLISESHLLQTRLSAAQEEYKTAEQLYNEAMAFSNLNMPYSNLEHLSFLTMKIGMMSKEDRERLKIALGDKVVIASLGNDESRVMISSSKKNKFSLDTELKRFNFTEMDLPKEFIGLPAEAIEKLRIQNDEKKVIVSSIQRECEDFSAANHNLLSRLLQSFSVGSQIHKVVDTLDSTQRIFKITGWISTRDVKKFIEELTYLTQNRCSITKFSADEMKRKSNIKIPVKLKHNKFVSGFEGIVFSYGCPLYGTIDPTPIVAFFFTLLFGIMFGDLGQGLVFLLLGLLLNFRIIKLGKWNKYAPVFIAIGSSASVMGILTGEFFANSQVLIPLSRAISGLFGEPKDHILHLMPEAGSMDKLFVFLGFTLAVGFVINSIGLIINIINQFMLKRPGHALFGKTGLCGATFFWYVIALVIRMMFFGAAISILDIVIIAIALCGVFFASPLERLVEGHRPVFENGIGIAFIEGLVELLEVVSSYLSNSVSFLRVGAFALAHAVLGFIIFTLQDMVAASSMAGGILVAIVGNAIVIVLEGMIVAIQVMRLQYYEFFSKFFVETGRQFKPFGFQYNTKEEKK